MALLHVGAQLATRWFARCLDALTRRIKLPTMEWATHTVTLVTPKRQVGGRGAGSRDRAMQSDHFHL